MQDKKSEKTSLLFLQPNFKHNRVFRDKLSHLHLRRLRVPTNGVKVGGVSCLEETELVRPQVAVREKGETLAEGEKVVAEWEELSLELDQAGIPCYSQSCPHCNTKMVRA